MAVAITTTNNICGICTRIETCASKDFSAYRPLNWTLEEIWQGLCPLIFCREDHILCYICLLGGPYRRVKWWRKIPYCVTRLAIAWPCGCRWRGLYFRQVLNYRTRVDGCISLTCWPSSSKGSRHLLDPWTKTNGSTLLPFLAHSGGWHLLTRTL